MGQQKVSIASGIAASYIGRPLATAHMELQERINVAEKVSREHYQGELKNVFGRAWLCVAHSAELPEAGDYTVVELPMNKASLLLCRGDSGAVRAFHNVCTHRGNKLVRAGSGSKKRFTCGFHGWTFTAEGALIGVPDEA